MRRILILSDHYFDSSDANAMCVANLVEEFKNRNFYIDIVTSDSGKQTNQQADALLSFFYVKNSFYERFSSKKNRNFLLKLLFYIYSFFRKLINLFIYPNVSPLRSFSITKMVKTKLSSNNYNLVLCIYRPFEHIKCCLNLSKKFSDVPFVIYHLDNLESHPAKNLFLKKLLFKKAIGMIKKERRWANKILVTPTSIIDGSNVFVVGFPVFKKYNLVESNFRFDNSFLNISYIGSLDDKNRNPAEAFAFLDKMALACDVRLKIHVWGNATDGVFPIFKKFEKIVSYHGAIDSVFVESVFANSDYLLNIGNKVTVEMLPSKLFRMFSTGKPIISFNSEKDSSRTYLDLYPKAIVIDYGGTCDVKELFTKLERCKTKPLELFAHKQKYFDSFTPSYIVGIILENLK